MAPGSFILVSYIPTPELRTSKPTRLQRPPFQQPTTRSNQGAVKAGVDLGRRMTQRGIASTATPRGPSFIVVSYIPTLDLCTSKHTRLQRSPLPHPTTRSNQGAVKAGVDLGRRPMTQRVIATTGKPRGPTRLDQQRARTAPGTRHFFSRGQSRVGWKN